MMPRQRVSRRGLIQCNTDTYDERSTSSVIVEKLRFQSGSDEESKPATKFCKRNIYMNEIGCWEVGLL